MSKAKRRQYTEEFKTEAVRLVRNSGQPVARAARDLGISDNVLYRWVSEHRIAASAGTTPPALKAEAEDVTRLRRELLRVTQERDFLKKAAAFFAKEHQ